jgi:O-antigen/teichoic acid export membrane protein
VRQSLGNAIRQLLLKTCTLRGELAWIIMGQILGFVAGFAGIKALTNQIGAQGYGQLALGLTIAGVMNLFVYGPVANVVSRYFAVYRERGALSLYFPVLRRTHGRLALLLTLLSLVAAGVVYLRVGLLWSMIVLLSCLYGVVSGVNVSFLALQSAIRQRKLVALHQGGDAWLRIALAIVLVLLGGRNGSWAMLGYLGGTLLVVASQRHFALRNREIAENWGGSPAPVNRIMECQKEFHGYAWPFVLFAVFAAISMYADRWILQGVNGESAVGIYAAIYQIAASPVNIFFAMVNQLMVPIVFERAADMSTEVHIRDSAALLRTTIIVSAGSALLITLVAACFSEPLVRLITNRDFARYHHLLWLSVLGLSLFNIAQLFTIKGLNHNRPRIYLWPKVCQAVSFLSLGYLLAKPFPLLGVAWGVCLSSAIYLLAVVAVNRRLG